MNKILTFSLLLSVLVSQHAVSETFNMPKIVEVLHPKLTQPLPFEDNSLCGIVVEVNDLEEFKKLPGIEIISHGLCDQNKWRITATLTKSQLLTILSLPFILEAKLVKPQDLIVIAQ